MNFNMRNLLTTSLFFIFLISCTFPRQAAPDVSGRAQNLWISGYYPGWIQEKVPPSKIRMDAITHLFHFAATVHADGTLSLSDFMLSDEHIQATVTVAHAAQKKVLLVLGGANSGAGFRGATSEANREKLIAGVVALVAKHGYDGIDLDWEPVLKGDNAQYTTFVQALHTALKKHNDRALLTVATGPDPFGNPEVGKVYAQLQEYFDQINLMTYVLLGAWPGWISWHGSPLYSGGLKFSNGRELPSVESNVANFISAGVRKSKLGIGIAFHGDVWTGGNGTTAGGVTEPQQKWEKPPTVKHDVAYSEIIAKYYAPEREHFDEVSQTPYLSLDQPGEHNDFFISYSEVKAVSTRLKYMKEQGLGGCIIWHLGQDMLPTGQQPLAEAAAQFRVMH